MDAAAEAVRRVREALPLCAKVDLLLTVLGLGASMFIWAAIEQPRRAVRLKSAIEVVRERSGLAVAASPSHRPMLESLFARLRDTAFAAALAEGGALSFDEAIQEALAQN